MLRLIAVVAVVALGYWYYTGPYQASRLVTPEEAARANAHAMDRCMHEERSISAGAAMAGGMMAAGDTEVLCADKLGLVQRDGEWVRRDN